MGTINSLVSSLFSNMLSLTPNASGLNATLVKIAPEDTYGESFQLSLNQQANPDGSDSDEALLYTSGHNAAGDGIASVTMATGDSVQSAYESMIASINSFGALDGTSGADESPYSTDAASSLGPVFNSLAGELGDNSGTASFGMGILAAQTLTSPTSITLPASNTSQTLSQFVNSIVDSL